MAASPRHSLLEIIENGAFWTLPDHDLLHVIKEEFHNELEFLKHAYSVRGHGWTEDPGSPSRILYPDEDVYDEINRTLVGILALRWINGDDYEQLTGCQPAAVRLQKESFRWIRSIYERQEIIDSRAYKLYALVTSMVSNDLGKSKSFIQAYCDATGDDIGHQNHDMILNRAAQRGMVPAIERLLPEYRDQIKRGIILGAEFNVGQLAQAENAPASLAPLLNLVDHEDAWNMRWMEQLLDLAGAAGHETHTCAQKLIEPIFKSYHSSYNVITDIVQRKLSLRQGYDQNLVTRYHLILESGWKPNRQLNVSCPEDRALMRLFCMDNAADAKSANIYFDTFYSDLVGDNVREQLVCHLERDGTVEEPAVLATYGPGMMDLARSNVAKAQANTTITNINHNEQRTLAAFMRYLARVYSKPPDPAIEAEGDVTVIERDCRVTIKDIIDSQEFVNDPDILDDAQLPEDAVANRWRDRPT